MKVDQERPWASKFFPDARSLRLTVNVGAVFYLLAEIPLGVCFFNPLYASVF